MKKLLLILIVLFSSCKNEYSALQEGVWRLTGVKVINYEAAFDSLKIENPVVKDSLFIYAAREMERELMEKGVHFQFSRRELRYLEIRNDTLFADEANQFTTNSDSAFMLDNGSVLEVKSLNDGVAIIHIDFFLTEGVKATQIFTLTQLPPKK